MTRDPREFNSPQDPPKDITDEHSQKVDWIRSRQGLAPRPTGGKWQYIIAALVAIGAIAVLVLR